MQRNTDTVPAMLTPGEFVIRKDAAEQIGPEKLHMLNNIDRLSNSALLENAKSPVAMQEGGEVQDGGFFSLFKDKVGGFLEQQGKNFKRAAMMEEQTGTRNPFLKTAQEQRALQRQYGLVPGGEITPPAPPQRPDVPIQDRYEPPEMLGDPEESVYNPLTGNFMNPENMSETDKVYYRTLPDLLKSTQKYDRYLDSLKALAEGQAEGDARREELNKKYMESLGKLEKIEELSNLSLSKMKPRYAPEDESVGFLDYLFGPRTNRLLHRSLLQDILGPRQVRAGYNEGGEVMHNDELMSVFGEKSQEADGLKALAALIRMQQMQQAEQDATRAIGPDNIIPSNINPRTTSEQLEMLKRIQEPIGYNEGGQVLSDIIPGLLSDSLQIRRPRGYVSESEDSPFIYEDYLAQARRQGKKIKDDDDTRINYYISKIQGTPEGEEMESHIKSWIEKGSEDRTRPMSKETVELLRNRANTLIERKELLEDDRFYERLYQDELTNPMNPNYRMQEVRGMMGGGYAKKYQQGGPVEPPMTGREPMMLEEPPMPMGEQAYYQAPADQLGLDPYEHKAYMKYGPDSFRYMTPNEKPRQQWTAYDALVKAGLVDPYEVDKDEVNVVTNDQMEELTRKAQMAMGS